MHALSSLLLLIVSTKLIQLAVVNLPTCCTVVSLEGNSSFVSREFGNSTSHPFIVKMLGHSQVQRNTHAIGKGDRRIGGTLATVRLQAVPRRHCCCCCCCFVVSHIQCIGCQPEKATLHGGQSRSWSAEQGEENKIRSLAAYPPPSTPHTALSEEK